MIIPIKSEIVNNTTIISLYLNDNLILSSHFIEDDNLFLEFESSEIGVFSLYAKVNDVQNDEEAIIEENIPSTELVNSAQLTETKNNVKLYIILTSTIFIISLLAVLFLLTKKVSSSNEP